jgi:hypothetical protein
MASYEQNQKLAQMITNDTTPQMSTIDVLSSLKLIKGFQETKGDENSAQKIANEELKYLDLAMKSISNHPELSAKFGSDFSGAMALTGLLKNRQSQRVYEDIFNNILETNTDTNLASVKKRIGADSTSAKGAISSNN